MNPIILPRFLYLWVNSRADWVISLVEATSLGEGKL